MKDKLEKVIERLAEKTGKSDGVTNDDANNALKYTQAILNTANAIRTLQE